MNARRLSALGLVAVLLFDVWWRGHTIAGTVRDGLGVAPWPVVTTTEPLDCDECIYGYIGKRIVAGDVMYRDLTENKPPLGYWLYSLAVAIGGASEATIRLMPVPMVLATIALAWWVAGRLAGPLAAVVAALIYALMSTDPYLYGNGANMEHAVNLFGASALALVVRGRDSGRRGWLVAAGACVAAAGLVKQVAVAPLAVFVVAMFLRRSDDGGGRPFASRLRDVAALTLGVAAVLALAGSLLAIQGAGRAAFEDVVLYGGALATDTPPDPKEYPFFVRWVVGNTDPEGRLPWPFGRTAGRAWWAAGSWPLWAVSIPSTLWAALARGRGARRLVAWWTLAMWVAVALPRLFWQHYFLLPLPGVAIVVAVALAHAIAAARAGRRVAASATAALAILSAVAWTAAIQVRDYLLVAPEAITTRYKGGAQWVALREIGRELRRRTRSWDDPKLWVWGLHSPLYFYSGIDGVTPQVFADPLIAAYSDRDHPLVRPRIERTMSDLRTRRPDLIFVGERPFPALVAFLRDEYQPSRVLPRGLWVRRDRFRDFESSGDSNQTDAIRGGR